jgi:hypothetical protein
VHKIVCSSFKTKLADTSKDTSKDTSRGGGSSAPAPAPPPVKAIVTKKLLRHVTDRAQILLYPPYQAVTVKHGINCIQDQYLIYDI